MIGTQQGHLNSMHLLASHECNNNAHNITIVPLSSIVLTAK